MSRVASYFDEQAAAEADTVIGSAIADFVEGRPNLAGGKTAVVVRAPAGAGKTHLVTSAAMAAVEHTGGVGTSMLIATPTNDQAFGLVDRLSDRFKKLEIAFVNASTRTLPPYLLGRPNVSQVKAKDCHDFPVVIGTLDKLGDAAGRGDLPGFRHLCIDESFQADSAKYYKVASLSDRHLLVGDPGQLDPFTTMADPERWRGLPEDPTQTAVAVLERNHAPAVHRLPITRRLPPSAVPLAEAFYPGHEFRAWTTPDARATRLAAAPGKRGNTAIDAAIDSAASRGWAWVRLPETPVLTADPATIETLLTLVRRLFTRSPEVRSESTKGKWAPLTPGRLAVVVSHNDQKDFLNAAFDAAGLTEVRVDTANKLQGLEFDFVVAWHPLAGMPDADGFHLDPGRLCVMLTRHRHGCIVLGRASDPDLITDVPPPSDAWLGHEPDPILDGWFAHSLVFERLSSFAVDL